MQTQNILRTALRSNAIFSALSGLCFFLFSAQLNSFLSINISWIVPAIGIGLILFAIYVYLTARADHVASSSAYTILAADIAWIIGSIAIILLPLGISTGGKWLIGILADIVLAFVIWQYIGLRRK